jgi:hypothetical protein
MCSRDPRATSPAQISPRQARLGRNDSGDSDMVLK